MAPILIDNFQLAAGAELDAMVLRAIGWTRWPGETDDHLRQAMLDVMDPAARPFPITHDGRIKSIPWSALARFERQAIVNYGRSLEQLAAKGGLSPCEAVAVIEGRPWERMPYTEAQETLIRYTQPAIYTREQCAANALRLARIAVRRHGGTAELVKLVDFLEAAAS